MPDAKHRQDFLNLCDMSIDNSYELEAIGELLEPKGILTKQEILSLAKDLKRKNPPADLTDLSAQHFTAKGNAVIAE